MALVTITGLTYGEFTGTSITNSDLLVDTGAVVVATSSIAGYGIAASGTSQSIEVNGTVFGQLCSLSMTNGNSTLLGLTLTVGTTGTLSSTIEGMLLTGYGNTITNAGHIAGGYGLFVHASSGATTTTITNSGSIVGHMHNPSNDYHAGIVHVGSEEMVVINTGLIKGYSRSYNANALSSGVDDVTNSGAMIGDILLGDGADIYDGRLGRVDGVVYGNAGADLLRGGIGDETINGGDDADELEGNGGNDTLDGGNGADAMAGGAGDDIYFANDGGDSANEAAGNGTDIVYTTVDWELADHVEHLILNGSGDLSATGYALANEIAGNTGNNQIDGGQGADTLAGGTGNDGYIIDDLNDTVIEEEDAGTDSIFASVAWTLGDHVENLALTGDAAINGTGNDLDNEITGNDAGNSLSGLEGNDILVGGAGNDVLDGGLGTDTMSGGADDDAYIVDDAGDVLTELSDQGTDTVSTSISWILGANFENLVLSGSGANNGTGNALANQITGNAGENRLSGLGAADSLFGNGGADRLIGGGGADNLNGGKGADQFIFLTLSDSKPSASGRDVIFDFIRKQGDIIDLSAIDANSGRNGDQDFVLMGETAFTGKAGQLRYHHNNGDTVVLADTNGDKKADFSLQLEGELNLVSGDFSL